MSTVSTVNEILNRVAVEVGLLPLADPFASDDNNFRQLAILLGIAGEELCIMNDWEILVRRAAINTSLQPDESGVIAFEDDYLRMVNQTMWDNKNQNPIPVLTAQEWALQKAYDTSTGSVYPRYRVQQGVMTFLPSPMPINNLFSYEYISSYWTFSASLGGFEAYLTSRRVQFETSLTRDFQVVENDALSDSVRAGADIVMFNKTLITRYLKLKWLKAKGLGSDDAQSDFDQIYRLLTTADRSGKMLNASNSGRLNTPDFIPVGRVL